MRPEVPEVSVVVPTFRRPEVVGTAVRSALAQTFRDLEVLVLVDGGDEATVAALEAIADPRLRVIRPARRLGNAGARQAAIEAARGRWIALLDDDDRWMPDKLAAQVETARASDLPYPIVSCRFLADDGSHRFLWPRRLPRQGQPISEYLFCRHRPSTGDGVVQTSTILAPTELFRKVPFDPDCRRFTDVDWLLRAARVPGAGLLFAAPDTALSVWSMDDRTRISTRGDWRDDRDWIEARRELVTPRAHAAFLLTLPSIRAARQGDRRAFAALLRAAVAAGRPGWAELAFHLGNFLLPAPARAALARRTSR